MSLPLLLIKGPWHLRAHVWYTVGREASTSFPLSTHACTRACVGTTADTGMAKAPAAAGVAVGGGGGVKVLETFGREFTRRRRRGRYTVPSRRRRPRHTPTAVPPPSVAMPCVCARVL